MNKLLQAYKEWTETSALLEGIETANGIPAENWDTRQKKWNEYCAARDEGLPVKKQISKSPYRVYVSNRV